MQKMSQRGINKELVNIVLVHGFIKKDKIILNKKRCDQFLKKLDKQYRKIKYLKNELLITRLNVYRTTLLKIRDKGGVTLVIVGDTLITIYNTNIRVKKRRRPKRRK